MSRQISRYYTIENYNTVDSNLHKINCEKCNNKIQFECHHTHISKSQRDEFEITPKPKILCLCIPCAVKELLEMGLYSFYDNDIPSPKLNFDFLKNLEMVR